MLRAGGASPMTKGMRSLDAAALVAATLLLAARPARAQDRFEIQVYDVETAPRGGAGLETHLNVVAAGTTVPSPDGEAPTDHQFHVTLEPHLGLRRWCELGAYLQSSVDGDGRFHYAGAKLRGKMRLPRRYARKVIGLALNLELSKVPARYEANVYGSELRPIIDVQYGRLYAALNPILSIDLAGPLVGRPQLEPAAKLTVAAAQGLAFGVEYYAGLGPVTGFLPAAQQTHRLFAVADFSRELTRELGLSVNVGAGYNLTGNGDRWLVKAIVGIGR